VACDVPDSGSPAPVDFGIEVPAAAISDAIANTYRDSDPTQTKLGAFVHFETNDDIAQGTMKIVARDTSQTITKRTEDANTVSFDLVENEVTYHQNDGTSQTIVRAYQLGFKKQDAPPITQTVADLMLLPAALALRNLNIPSNGRALGSPVNSQERMATPDAATPDPQATPPPVTFHRLSSWEDTGPAPAGVRQRANCLGIPQCTLRLRHVTYDMVSWQDPKGSRIHIELIISPDIPQTIGYEMTPVLSYIPGLLKSCVTQLANTGNSQTVSQTLITECQQVDDFLFQTATP